LYPKALFGGGGRAFEKRKEQVRTRGGLRGRFWRIYMNSSNSIYVLIIFLKFKIY